MNPFKKGQVIAVSCLAIFTIVVAVVRSRMVVLRYLDIFALILVPINILLSYIIPSPDSRLGQKLVLFSSISITCLIVGILLLKTVTFVGVALVGVSLLLKWFVVRPLQKQVRKRGAP
jgi:hypothetical protein